MRNKGKARKAVRPGDVLDTILWGEDSRSLGTLLPKTRFVNAVITSPPYYNLKDYGHRKQIGMTARSSEAYLRDLERVFEACYRVLREDGTLWIVSDSIKQGGRLFPLPFEIGDRLKSQGWILQDMVIWRKDKTLPYSFRGRFRSLFEFIHVYSKGKQFKFRAHREGGRHKEERRLQELGGAEARYLRGWPERYSPVGANPGNVWDIAIPVQGSWNPQKGSGAKEHIHFCPFPQELVSRILSIATDEGDVVLDPFAGSGTVATQAQIMGRHFVGVELNKRYKTAHKTIQRAFKSAWKAGATEREMDLLDRMEEGELILRLRQLKHASNWGEVVQDALDQRAKRQRRRGPKLRAVITVGRMDPREIVRGAIEAEESTAVEWPLDVYMVFDRVRQEKRLRKTVISQLGERALRKYGLRPTLHILSADELDHGTMNLEADSSLNIYPAKRCYVPLKKIGAGSVGQFVSRAKLPSGKGNTRFWVVSDTRVGIGRKKNVIEEALKKFVCRLTTEAISQLGDQERAAEYLGITKGELHRILKRAEVKTL